MTNQNFPVIYATVYGDGNPDSETTKRYGELNSMLLRFAVEKLFKDVVTEADGGYDWYIEIADDSKDTSKPPFKLKFGNFGEANVEPTNRQKKLSMDRGARDYCSNRSSGGGIQQRRGIVSDTIHKSTGSWTTECTEVINFYFEAVAKCFPGDYVALLPQASKK